jgi:hypothetical protein
MNIKVTNNSKLPIESNLKKNLHTLILFDEKHSNPLFAGVLKANIKRQGVKITDLKKTALSAELDNGSLVTWLMISEKKSTFQIHTLLRKALDKILSENPKSVTIVNESKNNDEWLKQAVYVASVNSQDLPNLKSGAKKKNTIIVRSKKA